MIRSGLSFLVLLVLAGCLPSSKFLEDFEGCGGVICPGGTTCAANQAVCIVDSCGDGVMDEEEGEECDDGNIRDGDGCDATCRLVICGNGIIEPGEVCDDGNNVSGDGCSADCLSNEVCGNGYTDVSEQCDDGNGNNSDDCTALCTVAICGDGFLHLGVEECDDGAANSNTPNACRTNCELPFCGDGVNDNFEQCDQGGMNTANCDSDCTVAVCGDGHLNLPAGEACDDGNTTAGDGCDPFCQLE